MFLQFADGSDMIDVRVGAYDLFRRKAVLFKSGQNLLRVVAGIDDDGLSGFFITEDCAVALQPADRKRFNDHRTSCAPRTCNVPVFAAPRFLKSTLPISLSSPGGSFCWTSSVSFSRTLPASSIYVASS